MEGNNRNNLRLFRDLCAQIGKSEGSGFENHALKCKDYLREVGEASRDHKRFVRYSLEKGKRDRMKIEKLIKLVLTLVGAHDVDGSHSKGQESFRKTSLMSELNTILEDTSGDGSEKHKETVDYTQDDLTSGILNILDEHFDRGLPWKLSEDRLTNLLERGWLEEKISSSLEVQPQLWKDQKVEEVKMREETKISNSLEEDKSSEQDLDLFQNSDDHNSLMMIRKSSKLSDFNYEDESSQSLEDYTQSHKNNLESDFSVAKLDTDNMNNSELSDEDSKSQSSFKAKDASSNISEAKQSENQNQSQISGVFVYSDGQESPSSISKDLSFQVVSSYNPFENEGDYELPEEEPLMDESRLVFVHPGLDNKGNNWFMTSILQMLLSIPEFVQFFYSFEFPKIGWLNKRPNVKKYPFTWNIQRLIKFVFDTESKLAKIDYIRDLSKEEFTLDCQHDALKYMLHLYENLQNELNPSVPHFMPSGYENYAEAWMEYSKTHNSIIDVLFVGMYEHVIICDKCVNETRTYEEFINVPLTIETDEKGSKSLEFFENQKEIYPSEYYCSKWKLITSWTIFKRICKAPKHLMLSIQRFDESKEVKDNDYVYYPAEFEVELPGQKKISYGLKTVVCHVGGLDDGQYAAYCRRSNYWRFYNDERVLESKIEEAMNEEAYMLVYKVGNFE